MTEYSVIYGVSPIRTDEEAQKVGEFLEQKFPTGDIEADEVVEAARPSRSPLHPYFEWDDTRAAEEYRRRQAQGLLRSIAVVRISGEGEERRSRAYHSVSYATDRGTAERRYVHERIVWTTPELADQVVVRAQRELLGWTARYSHYTEMRDAVGLVAEASETLAERLK